MTRLIVIFVLAGVLGSAEGVTARGVHDPPEDRRPAGAGSTADTVRLYRLSEIVVTATRSRIALSSAPSPVVVLDLSERSAGATRLSSVLEGLPGMLVRDLGGGNGVKTLSVRGTSGNHTIVLLNGVRLNNAQNGLVDLGLWMSEGVRRVEYVRGGQSALYGPDALGGAVNLITGPASDSLEFSLQGTSGSYGLAGMGFGISGSSSGFSLRAGGIHEQARGNFAYDAGNGAGIRERSNAGHRLTGLHASLGLDVSPSVRVSLVTLFQSADRGSPGPVSGAHPLDARLKDLELNIILQSDFAFLGGTGDVSLHHQAGDQRYIEKSSLAPVDAEYVNRRWNLSGQWVRAFGTSIVGILGAEFGHAGLLAKEIMPHAGRWNRSVFASAEWTSGRLAWGGGRLSVFPTLRYDSFSDSHDAASPKIGFNLWLTQRDNLQLKGSAGLNFRVPNFNELYWVNGGNPHLRHEQSSSIDLGTVLTFEGAGQHVFEVSVFEIAVKDRISGWPPVNLSRSRNRGAEATWEWKPSAVLSSVELRASYTQALNLTPPGYGKQVPFVPRFQMGGAVRSVLGFLELAVDARFVSRSYTTLDNVRALSVNPYAVVDGEAVVRWKLGDMHMRWGVSVENALNQSYEVMKGYPMPRRSYRVSVLLSR